MPLKGGQGSFKMSPPSAGGQHIMLSNVAGQNGSEKEDNLLTSVSKTFS